ncbi:MAG: hypothetical protein PHQ23_04500, partial [Candidatus Wallbacteria bacterium]|nr:hypothetical protein [Candidatus Wallbacteria bacterium]
FDSSMKNKYNFVCRDNAVVFASTKYQWPDANKRWLGCAGTVTLRLKFGDKQKHHVSVKNTPDWLFMIGHGSHKTGAFWSEFADNLGMSMEFAQAVFPPPHPDILPWQGELETALIYSCSIFDINDYNFTYPMEHFASPGALWANLDDITFLGFNTPSLTADSGTYVTDLLKNEDSMLCPESVWLSLTKQRGVCAITRTDDYIFWQRKSNYNLPVVSYELRLVPKTEWINAARDPKVLFNPEMINSLLGDIEARNQASDTLKACIDVYNHLRIEQSMGIAKVWRFIDTGSGERSEFLAALRLLLERTAIEAEETHKYWEAYYPKALEAFDAIYRQSGTYSLPAGFMLALGQGMSDTNAQRKTYSHIAKEWTEANVQAEIGLAVCDFNDCRFDEFIRAAKGIIANGAGMYENDLKGLIKKAEELKQSQGVIAKTIEHMTRKGGAK